MKKQISYTLEKAAKRDIPAIVKLQEQMADYHHDMDPYWAEGKKTSTGFLKYLGKNIQKRSYRWLVAKSQNKVIAFFRAKIEENYMAKDKKVGHFSTAFVAKAYRNLGITSAAFKLLKEWFSAHGIHTIILTVALGNSDGVRAWECLGFKAYMQTMKLKI